VLVTIEAGNGAAAPDLSAELVRGVHRAVAEIVALVDRNGEGAAATAEEPRWMNTPSPGESLSASTASPPARLSGVGPRTSSSCRSW